MFANLTSRTYFLFAGLNLLWIPVVFLFYPETKDRSLESIEAMFSSRSPFYPAMERAYRKAAEEEILVRDGAVSTPEVEKPTHYTQAENSADFRAELS